MIKVSIFLTFLCFISTAILFVDTPGPLVEKVVSCTLDDCAPLFVASKAGNVKSLEYSEYDTSH